ncbi:MAG: hypothetical protein K0R51_2376 [Cytophagaceae bacterium]|jgi:hypothetical protein|nr:hypothetical protein [Cytophagaceae bacterium]
MKYPIIFSLLFVTFFYTAKAQNDQQQPQPTPEYPMQKNAEPGSQSQEKKEPLTPEQKAQKQTDHLQKKLGLTEEQKLKVYDLNLARINQTQAAREKNKTATDKDRQAKKAEFQKIRTDYDAGLNGILNVDQQKIWTQLKADAKTKRDARRQQKGTKNKQPVEQDPDNLDID